MKRIGDYEVLGLLGKGGMSRVYKVRRHGQTEIMALKLLFPHAHLTSLLGAAEIKRRFVAEARVMQQVRCRHIVEILDYDENHGRPFILMNYYCHNLGHLIGENYRLEDATRALRVDKAIRFTREALLGLSCLHRAGIVHRDLKPYNLLLDAEETVKIADFGLSKVRGEIVSGPRQLMVGSPYYAAPEQEKNPEDVDCRADLYSLGVMLYRLLTGKLPVAEFTPPSLHNPELDSTWDAFLLKALAHERSERYGSADSMQRALEALHQRWLAKISGVCRQPEPALYPETQKKALRAPLRRHGIKVAPRGAGATFRLDALWRPESYMKNAFRDNGDGTVTDDATGLTWEKAGSPGNMTWHEAHRYVAALNGALFAGRNGWRLPTVEELMSLLTPVPHQDDYCVEPVLERDRKWLWSADRSSFTAAWYVSADLGYIARHDFTCLLFVRSVCCQ